MNSSSPKIKDDHAGSLLRDRGLVLFILLAGLFIAVRLWGLTTYPLWLDEIFSLNLARLGWGELIGAAARDIVHPPLFYLLLKIWAGIGGTSLIWLRLFPALTSIASLIPFFLLCRELKLRGVEINIALLLMAVNGYLIYYAQELRMYSLLFFFTLCSLWLFVRWMKSEEDSRRILAWLFVVNLLLIYTQYFGLLIVGMEFVCVLFWARRRLLSFFIATVALGLCFAPWFYLVARAASGRGGTSANLGWLTRPHLSDLIWFYAMLHGVFNLARTTLPGLIVFGSPLLWCAWRVLRGDEGIGRRLLPGLALFSFLPALVAFGASWLLPQSVWGERYLIIVAAPYFILLAVAVNRLRPTWARMLSLTLIIAWAVGAGFAGMRVEKKLRWDVLTHAMSQIELAQDSKIKVYTFEEFVATPLRFSLEQQGERRFEVNAVRDMAALQGAHFWIAFRDTTWRGARLPQATLRENGCQVGTETTVSMPDQKVTIFPVDCR
jgi:uncharacterized membrane protein